MAEETKVIRIVVDSSRAVDGSAAATRALERMERAQGSVASSLDRMEQGLSRIAGVLTGALGARSILAAADAFTRFENALRVAGVEASNMAEVSTRLFGAANRNGVEIGALAQLYSRASMAAGELGASQGQLLKFVDGVTASLRLQGGSTEAASGALLQLSQSLGSGIVRAEEFNSILEGAFPIAQAAARGIDGMGGSVAKLRMAVISGEVSSAKFFSGLLKGFGETERQAAQMNLTVSQGLTVLNNGFTRFVGEVDKSTGFTADLGKALARTGAYMDDLAKKQELLSGKSPTTWINDTIDALDRLDAWLQRGANSINTWVVKTVDGLAVEGARGAAMFIEAFRLMPEQLGKLFTDAWNKAKEASAQGINGLTAWLAENTPDALSWLRPKPTNLTWGATPGGGASMGDYSGGIVAAGDAAAKRMLDLQEEERAKRRADAASIFYGSETGTTKPNTTRPPVTMPGKEGEATAERLRKALQDSARELDQARAFADAANQGADAVARLEVHFRALKTAQDVFGKAANDNSKGVAELTAKLEEQALATQKLKNLGDFRADTVTLREQNEILEAEVRLANELPEVRARELAILKTMQEVKAKGLEGETEAIEQRRQAIEQNERLKAQGEEIKRTNELWTAPLKSALENIQRSTADWINGMLEGLEQGKFSFQDFGKIGISIIRRMVAEMLSLAIVRPMLGSVVGALSSIGVVSPGTAASMGYGTSGSAGGGLSMPSFGGGGGTSGLGGMFGFWNQPIGGFGGPLQGSSPAAMAAPTGSTGASGLFGGTTWGQGIGALAGAGMGIYQLATANGSTGKTIGGIGSIIGAGVSLIPGIGQIAGPIISILSSIVPSLFGEPDTRTHSSTNANLRYGSGGWYTTGGAYGPGANSGQSESALRGLTGGIDSVFGLLGGVKDASKVWGLNASSWTAQGKDWSYTSNATHLVDPNGNREAWRMNMDDMMDTGAAQVAIRSILSGAVGEISATMKTALEAMRAASMGIKETAESITFVDEVYERLGKGALTVRTQFRELESKFGDMTETAKKLGLALEPVIAEQAKATERLGQDYIDNLIDPVAAQLRAWEDEKASILANTAYIAEHTDVVVDMARINEALLRKEAALKEQLYGGAISQLEDAIKRLTYGDLSNITGAGTLAGMRASFDAAVAQARAGDLSAYQRVANEGLALTDASRGYYASSPEYEAIRREILAIFSELQVQIAAGPAASPSATAAANANAATTLNAMQDLQAMFRDVTERLDASETRNAELVDLMTRLLSRNAA